MTIMNLQQLSGRKALITGGARRLGEQTVRALARSGVSVAIHFNSSREAADELCREIKDSGVTAIAVGGNLDDPDLVEPILEEAWASLGGLDFLVNNASIFPSGRLESLDWAGFQENLRVNAWAPFLLTRAFWKRIRGSERKGAVVNLLDTRLVGGDLAHAGYHLSKSVLKEVTVLTALEFAPELRVNGVAPGAVLSPEGLSEDYLEGLVAELPLRRRGFPGDIADAILYLLGAEFVSGQVIFVDGGRHLRLGGST